MYCLIDWQKRSEQCPHDSTNRKPHTMNTSPTPETDAFFAKYDTDTQWYAHLKEAKDFARKLERERDALQQIVDGTYDPNKSSFWMDSYYAVKRERDEAKKSYQTVKDWAHRIEANLNTILDRCCDNADGAPDATDLGKFANELVGLNNSLMLGDVQSLRAERDQLRNEVLSFKQLHETNETCISKQYLEIMQLRKVCDELAANLKESTSATCLCECSVCTKYKDSLASYNSLPHVKAKGKE